MGKIRDGSYLFDGYVSTSTYASTSTSSSYIASTAYSSEYIPTAPIVKENIMKERSVCYICGEDRNVTQHPLVNFYLLGNLHNAAYLCGDDVTTWNEVMSKHHVTKVFNESVTRVTRPMAMLALEYLYPGILEREFPWILRNVDVCEYCETAYRPHNIMGCYKWV